MRIGIIPGMSISVTLLLIVMGLSSAVAGPPHIIFIVADDLGWNDVGWHNPQMLTPNLNRLAKEGVTLHSSYVQPLCTPSRASFMTGYYPIRMGLQHKSIRPSSPRFIPSNFTLLPQALKAQGYATHMVGKWHLGFCNWKYTPIRRGFDSFYGYLYGSKDYYLHDAVDTFEPELKLSSWLRSGPLSLISSSVRLSRELDKNGFGFWDNDTVDTTVVDRYATELFSERAVKIIERHNKSTPLFLYLAFKSPHGPLQVPVRFERMYSRIRRKPRRKYCGMVSALDEAVGNVTRALQRAGLMDNLLLVFTSDNGGAVYEGGNNLPLRGAKTTLWEGGTRAAAFVFSKTLLQKRKYTHTGLFHAVDWFPTMAHVAGVSPNLTRNLDGVNQWDMLSKGGQSRRQEFLYNIDELDNNAAVRLGDWKLIVGKPGIYNRWYPLGDTKWANRTEFKRDRSTDNSTYLLYNIREDQEERRDMYGSQPVVEGSMLARLERWRQELVPAQDPSSDLRASPEKFGGVWSPGWC